MTIFQKISYGIEGSIDGGAKREKIKGIQKLMAFNHTEKDVSSENWKSKENKRKSRTSKTIFRRVEAIFTVLKNADDWMTVSSVANIVDINNTDLERWIDIIAFIQDQPRIDSQTMGNYHYLRLGSDNPNTKRGK